MRPPINFASLRTRTLFAFLVMLVGLVGVLLMLAETIIGQGFQAVEERAVRQRVEQAANALDNSIIDLVRVSHNYAVRDDSYDFVRGENPQYPQDNLKDSTFINLGVSYIAFVNTAGELVYARAFDLETGVGAAAPPELQSFGGPDARLLQHASPDGSIAGLAVLARGPIVLAAQPILPSNGEGPPAGTLLIGRLLDAQEIARLAELTRLPIAISRLDDPGLDPALQQAARAIDAGQAIVTTPLDKEHIRGTSRLPDLLGGPGLLLHLDLPREVYLLGELATGKYTLMLLGAGLLFGAIVFWMLERTVLARTIALSAEVAAVDVGQQGAQVTLSGDDELGQLGGAINQMLIRLDQAKQQIAESEQRYRQLSELSPDAIIIHDGQHIRYINSAGARLLGGDLPAALVGRPVAPAIGSVAPRPDGSPAIAERTLARADGSLVAAELVVLPFDDRGTPATQVIVRNITERKQLEQTLRVAKEAADAANRAKSHFLANMSHELRTPLTSILGYTELLERALASADNPDLLVDLGRIRTSGNHLLEIIKDVLDLSKIEAGHMPVSVAHVAVAPLLEMVAKTILPLAQRNGNRLEIRGSAAAGAMLTDEAHLRQILINLASNACKFTHDGCVTLSVSALPAADGAGGERVAFAVEDTGIGIRPEQMELLFRNFVQIDTSATRRYNGTGLGLALSRRLAQLLDGDITVVSKPGDGSTFTLSLPRELAAGSSPADPDAVVANAPIDQPAVPQFADSYETRIVLLIDDDPAVRNLLARSMAQRGLHFVTAASGVEGLELAAALMPDLIILDVLLPEMEGWRVLRELKEHPQTRDIPVLMLTIDEDAERGLVLGAAKFLRKPISSDSLAHEMSSLLSTSAVPLSVLLVEDDAKVRGYLRRALEHGGWIVDEAADGPNALGRLEQRQYALIMVDLTLPGMDGIALIAAIRARPGGDTLPIIVVTAMDLTPEQQAELSQSVRQVLRKGAFRGDEIVRSAWALVQWQGAVAP